MDDKRKWRPSVTRKGRARSPGLPADLLKKPPFRAIRDRISGRTDVTRAPGDHRAPMVS
jgi:hypothetical protein